MRPFNRNFTRKTRNQATVGNIFRFQDLVRRYLKWTQNAELAMNSLVNDDNDGIDRKTSRSICDAVGERLQQSLRPETSGLSSHLQHLMDELRRRDEIGGRSMSN